MSAGIVDVVCQALGHDPSRVLSVRMDPDPVVVTTVDAAGYLRTVTSAPSDAGPCPPPSGDGAPSPDAGSWSSGAGVRPGST